jgi:hypothetical protein
MQTLKFTPHAPVCNLVSACAGPVEIVEDQHDLCLRQDHSRIYRVRSLVTGGTCWAYITELLVEQTAQSASSIRAAAA